ncbi:MAG: TetR/AcrR family transcriptional regulator [Coriobacteriales bacterium]
MDLRVERTYRSLMQAFTELLEEDSYDSITVAALCERAMIRRTTFYKHFADKDEFFAFYLKSIRDEFEHCLDGLGTCPYQLRNKLMLGELLRFMSEHALLVSNAVNSPSSTVLFDALCEVIYNDNLRCLREQTGTADPEMRAAFIGGGILQMVRHWWAKGCPAEGEAQMLAVLDAM